MKIDQSEAMKRAVEVDTSSSLSGVDFATRTGLRMSIAAAIERAVRETAEECAAIAQRQVDAARAADHPSGGAELVRNRIRESFSLKRQRP